MLLGSACILEHRLGPILLTVVQSGVMYAFVSQVKVQAFILMSSASTQGSVFHADHFISHFKNESLALESKCYRKTC